MIKVLNGLCTLGVVEFQPKSEWASPSFFTAKKNGTVRFLTNFREVNKGLVRKPFPLPKTITIRLDPSSSKICTLIFPWGKYSYLWLPMGITGSPDIFQAKMW
eukprot:CCRYP_020073-RA/>CCRYP_020073-RA protein AED:0.43 eAED:0.43 QI:0/0/0/1/0/0/2/0/102